MQHGAGRQERTGLIRVVVDLMPVEIPSHAVELQRRVGRENRFEAHPLADVVHVRLNRGDVHGFVETIVTVVTADGAGGKVELAVRGRYLQRNLWYFGT